MYLVPRTSIDTALECLLTNLTGFVHIALSIIDGLLYLQDNFNLAVGLNGLKTTSRFILRDSAGKYCWDFSYLFPINEHGLGVKKG